MLPRSRCCAAALATLLAAAAAQAAPAPEPGQALAAVPGDSVFVVQLRGLDRGKDRLLATVKSTVPDLHPLLKKQIDRGIEAVLDGREIKGVNRDAPVFFVWGELYFWFIGEGPGLGPPFALVVPVTDYKDFRDGILKDDERKALQPNRAGYEAVRTGDEERFCFVDLKNGYAVATPNRLLASRFTRRYEGLDRELSKEAARRFLDADASLFLNLAAVNRKYPFFVDAARIELPRELDRAPQGNLAVELARALFDPGFLALTDCQGVMVTADFRNDGLLVHADADFVAESPITAALKDAKPASLDELGKLPAGMTTYTAAKVRPALFKDHARLLFGILGNAEGKKADATTAALADLLAAGPRVRADATSFPWQGVQVWQFDDPAKAVAAQRKLMEALEAGNTYAGVLVKDRPAVRGGAQEYGGFKFHQATLEWDFDKLSDGLGGDKERFASFARGYLGDGMAVWFGTDGKTFLQVTAKDWRAAQDLLDRYQKSKPLGEQPEFKEVRKGLPAEATFLGLLDVSQGGMTFLESLKHVAPPGQDLPAALRPPANPGQTAYVGLAVTAGPKRVSADLWVPGATANEAYKQYVEKALKEALGEKP
jgi:hypothetical protein